MNGDPHFLIAVGYVSLCLRAESRKDQITFSGFLITSPAVIKGKKRTLADSLQVEFPTEKENKNSLSGEELRAMNIITMIAGRHKFSFVRDACQPIKRNTILFL